MSKIILIIVISIVTIFSSCKKKDTIESILTNEGIGKLWDSVYKTDITGSIQKSYFTPLNSKDSIPSSSLFFAQNNVLKRYSYFSSDSLYLTTESDVIYSKKYTIFENKIKIDSHFYLIKSISRDTIILQRDSLKSKIFIILKSSSITFSGL